MGKGGGTLGNTGKSSMTEEQLAAAAEADARRRQLALRAQMLREQFQREKQMAIVAKAKIMDRKRKLMQEAKVAELQRKIETMHATFARDIDRKDALVQMYILDIEEAEQQFSLALRGHVRAMDQLLEVQDERLRSLEREFLGELEAVQAEFERERDAAAKAHDEEMLFVKHLQQLMDESEDRKRALAQADYERKRNVVNERNLERLSQLQGRADARLEELSVRFEEAHSAYLAMQDERVAEYKELVAKDRALVATIESRKAKADELRREVRQMRSRLVNSNRDEDRRNAEVEQAKAAMLSFYRRLKTKVRIARAKEEEKIRSLSRAATDAKAAAAYASGLGERIISLAERCRGLESESERIIHPSELHPAAGTSIVLTESAGAAVEVDTAVTAATHEGAEAAREDLLRSGTLRLAATRVGAAEGGGGGGDGSGNPLATLAVPPSAHNPKLFSEDGSLVLEFHSLERFHKKMNKALLERLAAEKEKERLTAENAELQSLVRQCLEGISVSEDSVDKPNSLLVVNGRSNIRKPPVRVAPGTIVHIDGPTAARAAAIRK